MRWLAFCVLAYLVVGLHVALRPWIGWQGATPDIVLLGVVFIAINAPRDPALLGCFILGLLQDLFTQQPLGAHAIAYGLVGLFITRAQHTLYREHFLTHFSMTLAGGLLAGVWLLLHGWVYGRLHPPRLPESIRAVGPAFWPMVLGALYSAVLAPLVIGLLQKLKKPFAFEYRQPTLALRGRS